MSSVSVAIPSPRMPSRCPAVSEYPQPSPPILSIEITYFADPKPPKPPNDLKIIAKQYDGRGYLNVKLMWCPSKSNLPVEKYKIFWSRYVNSKEGSIDTDIVYVKDVSREQVALNLALAVASSLPRRQTKWS